MRRPAAGGPPVRPAPRPPAIAGRVVSAGRAGVGVGRGYFAPALNSWALPSFVPALMPRLANQPCSISSA